MKNTGGKSPDMTRGENIKVPHRPPDNCRQISQHNTEKIEEGEEKIHKGGVGVKGVALSKVRD